MSPSTPPSHNYDKSYSFADQLRAWGIDPDRVQVFHLALSEPDSAATNPESSDPWVNPNAPEYDPPF